MKDIFAALTVVTLLIGTVALGATTFVVVALICGAPLFVACWIIYGVLTDNWGTECPHCRTKVYSSGCSCGRTPYTGSH